MYLMKLDSIGRCMELFTSFHGTDALLVASPCHSDSPYSSSAGSFESLLTAASV